MVRMLVVRGLAGATAMGTALAGAVLAAPAMATTTTSAVACQGYQHTIVTQTTIDGAAGGEASVTVSSDAGTVDGGTVWVTGSGRPHFTPYAGPGTTVELSRHPAPRGHHLIRAHYRPAHCSPYRPSTSGPYPYVSDGGHGGQHGHHGHYGHGGHHGEHAHRHSDHRGHGHQHGARSHGRARLEPALATNAAWTTSTVTSSYSCGGTQVSTGAGSLPSAVLFCQP